MAPSHQILIWLLIAILHHQGHAQEREPLNTIFEDIHDDPVTENNALRSRINDFMLARSDFAWPASNDVKDSNQDSLLKSKDEVVFAEEPVVLGDNYDYDYYGDYGEHDPCNYFDTDMADKCHHDLYPTTEIQERDDFKGIPNVKVCCPDHGYLFLDVCEVNVRPQIGLCLVNKLLYPLCAGKTQHSQCMGMRIQGQRATASRALL